jgi:hypothetical protein
VREHIRDTDTILGRGACARAGMTSKQVRDCEDSKVEPRSRSRCPEVHGGVRVGADAPSAPAERSSASGIIAHTSSLFSDLRDAGSFSICGAEPFQKQPQEAGLGALGTLINYPLPFELVTENLQPRDNSLTSANPLSMYPFFDKAKA